MGSPSLSRFGKSWASWVRRRPIVPPSSAQSFSALVPGSASSSDVKRSSNAQAPKILTTEMAIGCQDAMKLFLKHGLGMQRLKDISSNAGQVNTIVPRWQRMMEAFIGTQVHVLAGMGYSPDESGLGTLISILL